MAEKSKPRAIRVAIVVKANDCPVCHERERGARVDRNGPAKVASDDYRDGWGRIFGRREVGQA